MPRRKGKPSPGDVIVAKSHWTDTELTGRVEWVGSSHFTFIYPLDREGDTFTCQLNGDWRYAEETT